MNELKDISNSNQSDKDDILNPKYKRKDGRKSTLDSLSFNEQRKSEFEEELRISLCSLKDRRNSSGYNSSGGGSFLSDDESYISISNKLFFISFAIHHLEYPLSFFSVVTPNPFSLSKK